MLEVFTIPPSSCDRYQDERWDEVAPDVALNISDMDSDTSPTSLLKGKIDDLDSTSGEINDSLGM